MKTIILAAGKGLRLGSPLPKCLTKLDSGVTILEHQLQHLVKYIDINDIILTVGFKKELIMEFFPNLFYVYNNMFAATGTAKSLELALEKVKKEDVLWLNGDVVFEETIIKEVVNFDQNCMVANRMKNLGDEEVKYKTDEEGNITDVSKKISGGEGEALGINFIKVDSLELFKRNLKKCNNHDFFEKGIEFAIKDELRIKPLEIKTSYCMEIDSPEDLDRANKIIK